MALYGLTVTHHCISPMDVVIHQFLLKLPQPTRRFHMFLNKSSNLGCQFHFRSHSYSMGARQPGDIAVWTMALIYFILYTNIFYKELAFTTYNGPHHDKTCLRGLCTNKGTHQPAHLCSLISTFVIRLLEIIVCRLATSKFSS